MKNRRLKSYSATLLVVTLCAWSQGPLAAHEAYGKAADEPRQTAVDEQERKLVEITADYQLAVAPLIQRACADCHSGDTQYPWYSMMPGVSQWIKNDIEEARKHIEFSNGYPFQSHATPLEDLIAVEKSVRDGTMPPLRYRIMHSKARLNEQEKKRIIDWARRGQRMLQNEGVARAAESAE
ncbi:MAG TPA: heme-binding domain-containing protein [Oligoflexus sp.]|uniref:heme-binding domain-containing protein n=1 Tax=Oligoflexus sp. TaxID=1971216 RepID=UPI002D7FE7E3|nr:heme-binding domain-containing protein [Oligoflexus sp.]HET9238113.1 heme-binding domain-containing protein [Oligoflexus sp.]